MNKYIATIIIVLISLELGLQCIKENVEINNTRHQYETLQICDREREAGLMSACYILEDKYNVEYTCAMLPNAIQCAVEVK